MWIASLKPSSFAARHRADPGMERDVVGLRRGRSSTARAARRSACDRSLRWSALSARRKCVIASSARSALATSLLVRSTPIGAGRSLSVPGGMRDGPRPSPELRAGATRGRAARTSMRGGGTRPDAWPGVAGSGGEPRRARDRRRSRAARSWARGRRRDRDARGLGRRGRGDRDRDRRAAPAHRRPLLPLERELARDGERVEERAHRLFVGDAAAGRAPRSSASRRARSR